MKQATVEDASDSEDDNANTQLAQSHSEPSGSPEKEKEKEKVSVNTDWQAVWSAPQNGMCLCAHSIGSSGISLAVSFPTSLLLLQHQSPFLSSTLYPLSLSLTSLLTTDSRNHMDQPPRPSSKLNVHPDRPSLFPRLGSFRRNPSHIICSHRPNAIHLRLPNANRLVLLYRSFPGAPPPRGVRRSRSLDVHRPGKVQHPERPLRGRSEAGTRPSLGL